MSFPSTNLHDHLHYSPSAILDLPSGISAKELAVLWGNGLSVARNGGTPSLQTPVIRHNPVFHLAIIPVSP